MTDTPELLPTSEAYDGAPETIWAWPYSETLQSGVWSEGTNNHLEMERVREMGTTEYTRTDLHQEALAERDARIEELERATKLSSP